MSDEPDRDEDSILAGEYALGLLPPEEAAAFAARLSDDPALNAMVLQWTEDFALLADATKPVTPPAHVHKAIEARLFSGPARGPLGFMRRVIFPAVTLAVLAVAIFLSADVLTPGVQPPANPVYHADMYSDDGSLYVAAGYDATTAEMYVERREGTARPGRALELWLIEGDNPPVSLGVLPEDPRTRLPVPDPLRPRLEGGILAVSDEPPGGSPTGAPTGDVLAVGPLTNV